MSEPESTIVHVEQTPAEAEELPQGDDEQLAVGQWYWVDVKHEHGNEHWLGCIIRVGSNYAKLQSPDDGRGSSYVRRVHFGEFFDICTPEPNAEQIIQGNIDRCQDTVQQLMGRVREVTARLGCAPSPELTSGAGETKALATVNSGQDMGEYKAALVKAKKETLPQLFKKIASANKEMAGWMNANLIPLQAQARQLKGVTSVIEDRIFSVQLYAGLVEQVTQIADGEPAALTDKVHLLQRRHYMDEECLAQYKTGGMDFQGIPAFDEWLAEPENRDRLLPFPRCIVAFQVRRSRKDRDPIDFSDFIRFMNFDGYDKWTFLYIRNGQQLFRMHTEVEFDEKLFPDLDHSRFDGHALWATEIGRSDMRIITDDEHEAILEENRVLIEAHERAVALWDAMTKEERDKSGRFFRPSGPYFWDKWEPFTPESVYYDDIAAKIAKDIKAHNRIALILQGLLDRSPVLHPHPPWQLWTDEGFESALQLVYDESRALTAGDKPDFEAYRAKLNASLKKGSLTIGQDDAWQRAEAYKEARRMDEDYRTRGNWRPTHHKPYGDPGPGVIARIAKLTKTGTATFSWLRQRKRWNDDGPPIKTHFRCTSAKLLNVDAYQPGDFKLFFNDPRTRAEYLKWAPILLEAEEYHAGNRKVGTDPED